jgi:predicted Rossmann-fold nucleotide-binding protein
MMEALTLIQTGKIYDFPVILVGRDYWQGLFEWMNEKLLAEGSIDREDLTRLMITDDPEQVRNVVREIGVRLKLHLNPKRS